MGFKENLKEQLKLSGMYVKELSERSGVNKKTIDGYLNTREYTPSAENAVKIARALGVTVEFLVTGCGAGEGDAAPAAPGAGEGRLIARIAARLNDKNRRMALALLKAMQKQEESEAR